MRSQLTGCYTNMDMIEVDPKLFVTCRLCLEDTGQYQIVPSVQKQIKYCFDINVEPFDGLPQLICVKCKQILINFYAIKETLCEKQAKLIMKVSKNLIEEVSNKSEQDAGIQPQQDAVSSSQQTIDSTEVRKPALKSKRVIHSSDSETSCKLPTTKKTKLVRNKKEWDVAGYTKYYLCRICQVSWLRKKSLNNHLRTHSNLKSTYQTVFEKNCSVILEKIDDKPNLTGTDLVVVHNQNEIIKNIDSLCYIKYEKLGKGCGTETKHSTGLESTDSEGEIIVKPKRNKRRISSRSSNDTVVIERESSSETIVVDSKKVISKVETVSKQPPSDNKPTESVQTSSYQCISIDDSSDSDADRSQVEPAVKAKQPIEAQLGDYKIIQGIINLCVNAYHKKNDLEKSEKQVNTESQLVHKVLSIGRKIINRQFVNLNGLLRYLEHKNLGVVWVTKALPNSNSKESNFIRIITKLRGKELMDDDFGWIPVEESGTASIVEPDSSLCVISLGSKNVSSIQAKNLSTTQSQNLSNTKSQNLSTTQSRNLSNANSQNLSNKNSQNVSNTQLANLSKIQLPNLSDTQLPNLSDAPLANLSNTPLPNLSTTQSQNLSNTQLQNLSTIQFQNLSSTQSQNFTNTSSQISSNTQSQILTNSQSHILSNTQSQTLSSIKNQNQDTAVLLICSPPDAKSKLLNANPVANPKQLPRKIGLINESRLSKIAPEPSASFHNSEDNNFMPIITSATSLADPKVPERKSNDINSADTAPTDKPAPRIKVKPVSELMSERTLLSLRNEQVQYASTNNIVLNQNGNTSNTNEVSSSMENINNIVLTQMDNTNNIVVNQNVWPVQNQVSNIYTFTPPIHLVPFCLSGTSGTTFQTVTTNSPTLPKKAKDEYVIMSTVELPNTRTDAPYKYLKKLLRIYNITLFDPHEPVPPDFFCLIKFKVQFKQEPIEIPVVLCLSLFCSKNNFCFTVKDMNHVNIDITTMTPNWQWEIINVFRGDLVDKLLDNAQKHSQETRDFTNQFLCILKSIKFTKLS